MSTAVISKEHATFLGEAAGYLDSPSFLMRMADMLGRPLESIAPYVVPKQVAEISQSALHRAMKVAAGTIRKSSGTEKTLEDAYATAGWSGFWHQLATMGSGAVGGVFGVPGLTVELPITTSIMFRSIASIADDFGEDPTEPVVQLECLSVFSYGGFTPKDDAMESSYLTARIAMNQMIRDAVRFLARESAQSFAQAIKRGSAPVLLNYISRVAAQFNVAVSQKLLLQTMPIVGGVTGASINAAFSDHFNTVARYHFGIRKLEREYGQEDVQTAYRAALLQRKEVKG